MDDFGFGFLYEPRADDPLRSELAKHRLAQCYKPPKKFEHGKDTLVVSIPKVENGDGHPVEIWECRMPATFYRVRVLPSKNSCNEAKPGFELSTGSGEEMGRLSVNIALAVSEGMLCGEPLRPTPPYRGVCTATSGQHVCCREYGHKTLHASADGHKWRTK